jgi:DNA primase
VRDAVDMVALVSAKLDLRRAGVNSYFGCCPFHDERTASFHVSPDEKLYHCFGCSESGDPFDFVMQTEGLDFKGALESLADRFGVALQTEEEDPEAAAARARRERLYSLLRRAATFYARYLWEAKEAGPAREYLLGRGFTEEVLGSFGVGYAPSAWDRMLIGSRTAGYTEEELLEAGLAQRSQRRPGAIYDRFRERVMFPTADARGRVRGFGARAMRANQQPKYLNTSDSELYHKREVLYGIELARTAASKAGRMVLVEGYTDVIALHQAGIRNAVGIMGTSLTREQVRELVRLVGVVELCLDADRAGQDAMLRAAQLAADSKLELRVVPLPVGADPGELIAAEGPEALRDRVGRSVPFVVFEVDRILDRADLGSAEGKDRAIAALRPALESLPASVLRDELMQRVAGSLELSEVRLSALFAGGGGGDGGGAARGGGPRGGGARGGGAHGGGAHGGFAPAPAGGPEPAALRSAVDQGLRAERSFLALCIALPGHGETELAHIDIDALLTSELHRRAARHLAGRTRAPLSDLPPDDDELARCVADLVDRAGRGGEVSAPALEHARLLLELARVDRALTRARSEHRPGIGELARERQAVLGELHEIGSRLEHPV